MITPLKIVSVIIYCGHCGVKIGEGKTYGLIFYCQKCNDIGKLS